MNFINLLANVIYYRNSNRTKYNHDVVYINKDDYISLNTNGLSYFAMYNFEILINKYLPDNHFAINYLPVIKILTEEELAIKNILE